jgi:hypothetical protein
LVLVLGLLVAVPAMAENSTSTETNDALRTSIKTKRDATDTSLKEYKDAKDAQKLAKLVTFGDKSVDERTGAIAEQEKQLTAKGCSKAALTEITTAFQLVSTTLATQKASIDAAKTTDELKTKLKSVYESNRVYMFLVPASKGLCLSSKLQDIISTKLTSAVTKLKAAGIDTTAIETKLASAKTDAQSAYDTYLQVVKASGSDDAGNQAKMASAKTLLQNVRKTLGDVKSDIGNLIEAYKAKTHTTSSSDSSTPSTSATQ